MSDFAVQVKVKNGRLLAAILDAGYTSVRAFCMNEGFDDGRVGELLNFKLNPLSHDGCEWIPLVKRLSECLGPLPEELFPEHLQLMLESNSVTKFVAEQEMKSIVESAENKVIDADRVKWLLSNANISRREADILTATLVDESHDAEVGSALGITGGRVQQIRHKALRRIRNAASDES